MRSIFRLFVVTLFVLAAASGCNYSALQVKDSYLPHNPARPMKLQPRMEAEACVHRLFGFIPVSGDNRIDSAMAGLTRQNKDIDNVVGMALETKWSFWLLGTTSCVVVSGYPAVYLGEGPHSAPFSREMAGALQVPVAAGTRVATTAPAAAEPTGSQPVAENLPVREKQPEPVPEAPQPRIEPPVEEAPAAATPDKSDCEDWCRNFAGIWKGSEAIQSTIERNCNQKCMAPEKTEFRACIQGAKTIDDIGRCNTL